MLNDLYPSLDPKGMIFSAMLGNESQVTTREGLIKV